MRDCPASLTVAVLLLSVGAWLGCGTSSAPPMQQAKPQASAGPTKPQQAAKKGPKAAKPVAQAKRESTVAEPPPNRTFADLIAKAEDEKEAPLDPMRFTPPEIDEAKCAGRGIRKLASKHLTLYTDLPPSPVVDELPAVFDQAVPQWLDYFGIEPERGEKWHMIGVLAKEKERFYDTGLWPDDLPPFLHGYMRNNVLWLYEQPSDFYRRHLLLHEGTHGFMWAFLGGLGPPWFTEGLAELLGTHEWTAGKLRLNVIPPSKEASPMWGRVKIIKDGFANNQALPLGAIMNYPPNAHLKTEPYGWCWAAAVFFDHDPQFQKVFREAQQTVADVSPTFSERFVNRLPQPGTQVSEQWQCFVANIEYGYDVARESIIRKEAEPLPEGRSEIEVVADRGWQSSGYALEAGKTYELTARGQFQIGKSTKPWMSEANGITLRYYKGRPIGTLLAAVTDEGESGGKSPLLEPIVVGTKAEITPEKDGVLYLRVNDSPAELADNAGSLTVIVRQKD